MRIPALLLLALCAAPALAHQHATPPAAPASAASARYGADERAVREVVLAFGAALKAADLSTVERLLDPDVLVLESGGAERSRAEYMQAHAPADAKFLAGAKVTPGHWSVRVAGDLAWATAESTIEVTREGAPVRMRSTETMVLRRTRAGWRIVHIHWSSSKS